MKIRDRLTPTIGYIKISVMTLCALFILQISYQCVPGMQIANASNGIARTGSELVVVTNVINDNGGPASPSDFEIGFPHTDCAVDSQDRRIHGTCEYIDLDWTGIFGLGTAQGNIHGLTLREEAGPGPFGDTFGDRIIITKEFHAVIKARSFPNTCYADTGVNVYHCDNYNNIFGYNASFSGDCNVKEAFPNANRLTGHPYRCTITLNDFNLDADLDGISDDAERNGIDGNSDGIVDLVLPESNPLHRDLYLEIDYMPPHVPEQQAITNLINTFASAPVSNPDGSVGINLHLLLDDNDIPHQDAINLDQYTAIKNNYFGTDNDRADPNGNSIIAAKQLVYYYGLLAHRQQDKIQNGQLVPNTSSGNAYSIPNMYFVVTLGSNGFATSPADPTHPVGSRDDKEAVILHEFGHNLGLRHGGDVATNCKPNYMSVLSYSKTFSLPDSTRRIDYSQSQLNELNEQSLYENVGITASTPPGQNAVFGPPSTSSNINIEPTGTSLDWNQNGIIDHVPLPSDVNHISNGIIDYGDCYSSPGQTSLRGHNDWSNLKYLEGKIIRPDGTDVETINYQTLMPSVITRGPGPPELTAEDRTNIRLILLDDIRKSIQQVPLNATALNVNKTEVGLTTNFENITNQFSPNIQGSIANLLSSTESEAIEEAIRKLNELKTTMDSSFGGDPSDDVIIDPTYQNKIVKKIDNLVRGLELQLETSSPVKPKVQ
jgi:hypothetical protein